MKNLLVILLISMASHIYAQEKNDSPTHIKAGIMFIPQSGVHLEKIGAGFESFYPVFVIMPITKRHFTITPFLNMTANAPGISVKYTITEYVKVGIAYYKKMHVNDSNIKGGLETPVWDGKVSLFVHYSDNFPKRQPYVLLGALIPLTFKLK